ncbi:cupredoxin domain-containing protein [Mycobacterium sp. NPDC051804]|uniref:cupredoxin domain-containing protein n=1 Tax=Mycobacterium sp. NPDC051804 TaxID=3364295 RepID=UPI0037B2E8A8
MKKILLLCMAVCLAIVVAACDSESSYTTSEGDSGTATATASPETTSEAPPAEASGPTITMANMSFGEPITVAPGATITVKNDDSAEHSVTSQTEGKFDVHVDAGEQGTLTAPTEPGEYAFYCIYHPSMKGTLIVQ